VPAGPEIPDWSDAKDLDPTVRAALRGLESRNAERVARHLVAAGTLVDDDPEAALAHAHAARDRASRIAAVREAVGVTAYHAGDYAEAARELRAYRRMSGDESYRAVLADCERALGRPEVALRLVAEALAGRTDADEAVELRLVEAGARRDLGETAAARLVLEKALGGRPTPALLDGADPRVIRLATAYADLLEATGEGERAAEWSAALTAVDAEELAESVEFFEEELSAEDLSADSLPGEGVPDAGVAEADPARGLDPTAPDGPLSFDEEVEAEVAELLGETEPQGSDDSPEH
jgi:hypothetical protein